MFEFKYIEMKIRSFLGVRRKDRLGPLPLDVMLEVTSLLGISALTSVNGKV